MFEKNVLASTSNISVSDEFKASEVQRAPRRQTLSKLKINEEAVVNDAGELQNKSYDENWDKTEESDDPTLLHDDHDTIDDNAIGPMEDCLGLEKVEGDLDKI